MDEGKSSKLDLPGFRFHPTEEELLDFYLKNMVMGKKTRCDVIGYLNIYCHDPSELPGLSKIGEREWYFLVPIDRKHGSGGGRRPNRTTANGFWKATGSDRKIVSLSEPKRVLGFRKTLVFYYGRAPRGTKTDWVMNEYRLPDSSALPKVQDIVLCKIYRKATSLKVLEQRAAMEEEIKACNNHQQQQNQFQSPTSSPLSSMDTLSFCSQQEDATTLPLHHHMVLKEEIPEDLVLENEMPTKQEVNKGSSLQLPFGKEKLPELQLPNKGDLDWNIQDSFSLTSPWLQTLTPSFYANILTPASLSEPEFNCR